MKSFGLVLLMVMLGSVCAVNGQNEGAVSVNQWSGKVWTTYGNSITAMGNGNHTAPFKTSKYTPWQILVSNYLNFAKHYGRGVGGQTFCWNENIWWANPDGTYAGRPNGKNEQPQGTEIHPGAYCSWDRIKTMIPQESDVIFIMGGTNDIGKPLGDLTFVPDSKVDKAWAESEFYVGDFDISSFKGGVASTIMKVQAWCPDAIIVLGTPLSGRGSEPGPNMSGLGKNMTEPIYRNGLTTQDYAKAVIEVANYMSIPVIDVFGTSGINQFNRARYIPDTVHPSGIGNENRGNEALARVVISGLKNIMPNF